MNASAQWRELCRFDDPQLARAVATSIASMEFEVRLRDNDRFAEQDNDEPTDLTAPPCIVQVDDSDWATLTDILDEIIDEQIQFDQLFEMHHVKYRRQRIVIILTLAGVVEALVILGLIEL